MISQGEKAEQYFEYGNIRYRYLTWASGSGVLADSAAPLVLVHGFSQQADSWNDVAGKLSVNLPVYAFELVGHGKSNKPTSSAAYTLREQAKSLLAFLRFVAVCHDGVSPALVGYSMGGRVALSAWVDFPLEFSACVSCLVLESVGFGSESEHDRLATEKRDKQHAARLRSAGLCEFMNTWENAQVFASQKALPDKVRAEVRASRMNNDSEALARSFEYAGQHEMPSRKRVLEVLSGAQSNALPVLYLAGGKDEKYRTLSQELLDFNHIQIRIVPEIGHNVHLEAPDIYARALEQFCSR